MDLARSSFYAAKKAKRENDRLDNEIWKEICTLWKKFPGIGYRKICRYLPIGKKRIQKILRKFRGKGKVKTKKKRSVRKYPNLLIHITNELIKYPEKLKRGNWVLKDGINGYRKLIEPVRPYQLWAADWKEYKIPVIGLTIYIFAIIDCYTRQLMGFNFSLTKDSNSALVAAEMAFRKASKDSFFNSRNLIIHSDGGGAYRSDEYTNYWKGLGVSISMADPGKPTQNPYIEAFFSILTRFWLNQYEITSAVKIEKSLTRFFNLYNREWKHSSIDYKTPDEYLLIYKMENHIS